jgi:anti-sigma B factor antagonist
MVEHELRENGDRVSVQVSGDLDWSARLRVEPVFEVAVEQAAGREVVVDLRPTTFIDSSGVSLLIETSEVARERGVALRIVRPEPQVFRVFEVLGLDGVLPFEEREGGVGAR